MFTGHHDASGAPHGKFSFNMAVCSELVRGLFAKQNHVGSNPTTASNMYEDMEPGPFEVTITLRYSEFIIQDYVPSFLEFQQLSPLIRDAIVQGTIQQDQGIDVNERDLANWVIQQYDYNEPKLIGELIAELNGFIGNPQRCSMARCYVDNGCDMVAAKLAWHEGYDYPCIEP